MPKSCKLCTSPKNIQECVINLKEEEASHRKIEAELASRFHFKIAATSIGHHLNKCLKKKAPQAFSANDRFDLQEIDDTPPKNTTVHQELCNVLTNTLIIFNKTIGDMAQQGGNPQALMDAVKTLDVLINGFEKLYQNPKDGLDSNQEKIILSDLQLKIMKEVAELPEAVSDEEVKAKVAETFKNHDDLVKDVRGDQVL
ncbi:unnamed protein product [Sphagnum jensenii]|uniref:Uncharacterized protein n=1 Tax=Sphagnum jensenii TaxID=128206 RepID=A0ABP0V938_9BRYO